MKHMLRWLCLLCSAISRRLWNESTMVPVTKAVTINVTHTVNTTQFHHCQHQHKIQQCSPTGLGSTHTLEHQVQQRHIHVLEQTKADMVVPSRRLTKACNECDLITS